MFLVEVLVERGWSHGGGGPEYKEDRGLVSMGRFHAGGGSWQLVTAGSASLGVSHGGGESAQGLLALPVGAVDPTQVGKLFAGFGLLDSLRWIPRRWGNQRRTLCRVH